MSTSLSNNKRVAKNTLLLYFRMLVLIVVGLYSSRVVLNTLGVSDYGVYNVVGGIVSMLAFLNSAMTAASQRFISFELGIGNLERLKKVFSTSVSIHLILAVIIFVIAETFGLWFLNTYLNIEAGRMTAANWVYQCSVLTLMLTIASVPYNSCIVAHEHMRAFAYVGILEAILKLLIVYLLLVIRSDKLITYSLLVLCVALVIRLIYGIYCKRYFEECHYRFSFDCRLFAEMFSFAGWSIVGNMGFSLKNQGSNVILNLFFGTIINAARGIAMHVNGIIANFSNNFMMALAPQITKQYAAGNVEESIKLVYVGSRYSFFLLTLIATPVLINVDYLLTLWLGTVPKYTSSFLQLTLVAAMINSMATPLVAAIQATGKIRLFQIAICIVMSSELPLAYFLLFIGGAPYTAMYPTVLVVFIGLFVRFLILKHLIPLYGLRYFSFCVVGKNLLIGIACVAISMYFKNCFDTSFVSFLLTSFISCAIVVLLVYVFGITGREREIANRKFCNLISKRR